MIDLNCACPNPTIALVFGIERCAVCGKVTGADAFRPFGAALPTKAVRRKRVSASRA